jgi:mannose-1-phosphate guanylyltransferase
MHDGGQTEQEQARRANADGASGRPDVVPVLIAGGFGTRLWPLSTPERPKQFLTELQDRSLFQQTLDRAHRLAPAERVLVMTSAALEPFVCEQAPDVPAENVIPEPLRRDTAPAAILAALVVAERWPEAVIAVFPSDHFIGDEGAFAETVAAAVARAADGGLGTIGIPATSPATGYGYLRLGREAVPLAPQPVEAFVEKPDRDRAEAYVASGQYLWNSGIFVWRPAALLEAAERHLPETVAALRALPAHVGRPSFGPQATEAFERIAAESVDCGIMEKAADVWCVPAAFDWDDVGGWEAAGRLLPADDAGNRVQGDVVLDGAERCIVLGEAGRPVAVAGMQDCIVVQGPAGTLVCPKSAADRIKPLVQRILDGGQP